MEEPDPVTARLDQSIEDFKTLIDQRFRDLSTLLNERFGTQTKALDAAFIAAALALTTALKTATDTQAQTEARVKVLENAQSTLGGRGMGRADVLGWMVAAAIVGGFITRLFFG